MLFMDSCITFIYIIVLEVISIYTLMMVYQYVLWWIGTRRRWAYSSASVPLCHFPNVILYYLNYFPAILTLLGNIICNAAGRELIIVIKVQTLPDLLAKGTNTPML